jgi:hypothetical protein
MLKILLINILTVFCLSSWALADQCMVSNCHGAKITCGPESPRACSMDYMREDACRRLAHCGNVNGNCQVISTPAYEDCVACAEECHERKRSCNCLEEFGASGLSQGDLSSRPTPDKEGSSSSETGAPAQVIDRNQDILVSAPSRPVKGTLSKEDAISRAEQWAESSNPPMSLDHLEPQAVYLKEENAWIIDFIDTNNAEYMLRVEAASGKDPELLKGSQVQRYKSYFDMRR